MTAPNGTRAYLICATPRTGSTLLCGLLADTEVAGRPESYFRRPDEGSWAERRRIPRDPAGAFDYRDYVRAAVAAGSTENGIFGARVMWGTMTEIVAKLSGGHADLAGRDRELLRRAFGRTSFVLPWRADTVAQAVSWVRAEQTNHWQHGDPVLPGREPYFDIERIHRLVRTIEEHNAACREWFAACDVEPHLVRYEELTADMAGVTRGILGFLGLEVAGDQAIRPRHHRQADGINDEWVARYRATVRA